MNYKFDGSDIIPLANEKKALEGKLAAATSDFHIKGYAEALKKVQAEIDAYYEALRQFLKKYPTLEKKQINNGSEK